MRRQGVLVGLWVLCTAAATLIAWAAVSQVAQEVSPQAVMPLPETAEVADAAPTDAAARTEAPPAPTEPSAFTEAYNLTGGVVTVRYGDRTTDLVEASPESGFVAEVQDGGPEKVDVRFRSDDHESRLVTRIRNGAPDPQREERPR